MRDAALRHLQPRPGSQRGRRRRPHLAAQLHVRGQVLLGAKSLGTGGTSVASLLGVHGRQVPVQVRPVPEVLQAVRALHQLLLKVDGLLVPVGVGLEGEAGGTLGALVARGRAVGGRRRGPVRRRLEVERLARRLLSGSVLLGLRARPVQGQGHEGQGVAVLVVPEMLQAAEQPLAQGAGEAPRGPGTGLWQDSVPRSGLFARRRRPFGPGASRARPPLAFQGWRGEKRESQSERDVKRRRARDTTALKSEPYLRSRRLYRSHRPVNTKHHIMSHLRSYTRLGMLPGHAGRRRDRLLTHTDVKKKENG